MNVVPEHTRLAARRGFVRTAAQSLSSAIPTTGIVVAITGDWLLGVGLGVASALVTAGMAGAASYLDIVSKGVPDDYANAVEPRG